ncbi:MAG: PD-(D/E)XK nuclease family protein [Candidatus Nanohalobium sp.]
MKVRKTRDLEEIAERASEYDKVLTVEPSLADAVNRRLREKGLEENVDTPFRTVDAEPDFRRKSFLRVVQETGFTWKQASYLVDNVLDVWERTGDPENILDYERYSSEEFQHVVEITEKMETPFSKLERHSLEGDVAVIKLHQFSEMDRKILPEDFNEIDTFTSENCELPEFNVFPSASDLSRAVRQKTEELGAEKVGVAVKPGSKYEPVLKSMLEARDIPFQRSTTVKGNESFRTFLSLLEAGLKQKKVRVRDVLPIAQHLDIYLSKRYENMKLEDVEEAEELKDFLNVMNYLDYSDAVEKYSDMADIREEKLMQVLEDLGIKDEKVSEHYNNALRYYAENFSVGGEVVKEGVLLADPTEVSWIDRDYVFMIGMGTDWMREVPEKPWTDQEELERGHLEDFESLIQSGRNTYYLVEDKEMNEEVTPCLYLDSLLDRDFSSFTELPHRDVKAEETRRGEEGFGKEDTDVESSEVDCLSQSKLNSYAQSPRLYYFDRLVSEADRERFRKGNLFHQYAEFHVNNPEKASSLQLEEVVEFMMQEMKSLTDEIEMEDLRTEFTVGIENIRAFLDSHELPETGFKGYKASKDENVFIDRFGGVNGSRVTEAVIRCGELGIRGKVDLLLSRNHLVDYKSGNRNSTKKVVKKSHVELFEEEKFPDFQPLMYITYHRKHHPGEEIKFTFLHFLNDIGDSINGGEAQTETTVHYYPEKFQEKKASMEMFEELIRDVAKSNDRRKTLEKLGYQQYKNFMKQNKLEELFDKQKAVETGFREELEKYAKQEVGDYKYVEKGVEKTVKKLVDIRSTNYFREDADKMEEFLDEKIEEINEYIDSRFPVDANPDKLPQRDLILK